MNDFIKGVCERLTDEERKEIFLSLSTEFGIADRPDGARAAVITDIHRGVGFGYVPKDYDGVASTVRVTNLRHCWGWDVKEGIGQLASDGPGENARIGATVTEALVRDVSKVLFCTAKAEAAFLKAGWK